MKISAGFQVPCKGGNLFGVSGANGDCCVLVSGRIPIKMERKTRVELATSSLENWRSTN